MRDLVEDLSQRARALSPEDRAQPAEKLLESLHEDTDPDIEAAWDAEIRRRVAEVESGAVKLVPAEEVFDEIQRSNMSKLGEDGKPIYREDGKVLKGPNYFKPDFSRIIK